MKPQKNPLTAVRDLPNRALRPLSSGRNLLSTAHTNRWSGKLGDLTPTSKNPDGTSICSLEIETSLKSLPAWQKPRKNNNSTYFKLTRCFCFLLRTVFIKGLLIFLMKKKVLHSNIMGIWKTIFLPYILVIHKQTKIWKCRMKYLLVVVCNLHIYGIHHYHHNLGQTFKEERKQFSKSGEFHQLFLRFEIFFTAS